MIDVKLKLLVLSSLLVLGACAKEAEAPTDVDNEEIEQVQEDETRVVELNEEASEPEKKVHYDLETDQDLNEANLTLTGAEIRETYRNSVENVIVNMDRLAIEQVDGKFILKLYIWDGAEHYYMDMDAETGEILNIAREDSPEILDIVELWEVISPFDMVRQASEDAGDDKIVSFNLYHDDELKVDVYEIIKKGDFLYYNAATGENITDQVTPPEFEAEF